MKYAILSPDLQSIESTFEADVLPPHKPGRVVPVVVEDMPDFDPATHKVQLGDFLIGSGSVTQKWDMVPLTSQELYEFAISAGYTVSPEGYTLRLSDADRMQFSQMLALVKEALELGLINNDTAQTIADNVGVIHEVTTLRFRQIMVAYGMHYKSLWDNLATSQV